MCRYLAHGLTSGGGAALLRDRAALQSWQCWMVSPPRALLGAEAWNAAAGLVSQQREQSMPSPRASAVGALRGQVAQGPARAVRAALLAAVGEDEVGVAVGQRGQLCLLAMVGVLAGCTPAREGSIASPTALAVMSCRTRSGGVRRTWGIGHSVSWESA